MQLIAPRFTPPLEAEFRPAVLANHAFLKEVNESGKAVPLVIALERTGQDIARYETFLFDDDHPRSGANLFYAERLFKFILWQYGGRKAYIAGPRNVILHLQKTYSEKGSRAFDYRFMSENVYQEPFTINECALEDVPARRESATAIGRHLKGYRIGFDLGASDLKVSAVVEGKVIFSQEIAWEPREQPDPSYHYNMIISAIKLAASKMPRVDAIGGSAAGVHIDDRPMISSLYRGVPKGRFDEVRSLFARIREEMGVPMKVINDGDVTALAGSMSLKDNAVLGIALGSSQAAGYVDRDGKIMGWLNELAFAPIDYDPNGPCDNWSQDRGVGSQYFSQQCVFRLAPKAGIQIPVNLNDLKKLEFVQEKLEAGHEGARKIWGSMGYFMGYGVAHYADFYDLKHVLILGRCTSGLGGTLILEGANKVLSNEFPELTSRLNIQLPDEESRRVGQSIAAASLPE